MPDEDEKVSATKTTRGQEQIKLGSEWNLERIQNESQQVNLQLTIQSIHHT
jgi:hypothetical protein